MKKILLLIPCIIIFLFSSIKADAEEYNGVEYGSVSEVIVTNHGGYVVDVVYCAKNPDAKLLYLADAKDYYVNGDQFKMYQQYIVCIGAETEVDVYFNGELYKSFSLTPVNMEDLANNPLTEINASGVNIGFMQGLVGDGWTCNVNESYNYSGVTGYFTFVDNGIEYYLTYGELLYILQNIEDLRVQPEEYDEALGVPSFLHHKDSLREYLSVTNPSGKKIEMNIKIYGPSSIYIESISKNPLDKGLDMYEFAVTSEIGSNYVSADGFSDSCDFYMWGLENSSITEGENYVFLGGMFSDFTQSCASNCEFEYKDYFTQIQDSANKLQWDMLLTLANSNLYEYEIYARFYDDSGSVKKYGSWQHLVLERGGNFKQGTDDDGVVDIPDDEEDNRDDDDLIPIIPEQPDYSEFDVTGLWEFIATLANSLGQVPAIVSQIFSFLPDWVMYMVGFGIAAIVILRFLGR